MATQKQIFRELKAALCNCPPSRLKEMTPEATNGLTSLQLEGMANKLDVIALFLRNQVLIRKNKEEMIRGTTMDYADKHRLIEATKKGWANGSLR